MGRIDQSQPIARPDVVYYQRFMGTSQVSWGPTTTATILENLSRDLNLRWVGLGTSKDEYVVYAGEPGGKEHIAEVKFRASSGYSGRGWLHIASDNEAILEILWARVTEAIGWPTEINANAATAKILDF